MKHPIIIIGSGLAGYETAKEFRKFDNQTPLIIITKNNGDFYSKPMLSTALTANKNAETLVITKKEDMAKKINAEIKTHCVVDSIDTHHQKISLNDGSSLSFSKLILACGAKPITPLLKGNAVSSLMSVNELEDYDRFRQWLSNKKHIAVLGAGLVGCEFTNDLINAGYQVDVIEAAAYPLSALLPESISHCLQKVLEEKGVRWHCHASANSVDFFNQQIEIILSNNKSIKVDGVLSAVGLRPDITLAQLAQLKTNRGIVVNEHLQTSHPNIFALGDCAEVNGEVRLYIAPLLQSARALAKVLAGIFEPVHYSPTPIVIKTPACPLVSLLPPKNCEGRWKVSGEGYNVEALFFDENEHLKGFALSGDQVRRKVELLKLM
jgi:rubredoxin-NAD+ reductase